MVGGDVTEGISGDGADRFPVHFYAGNTMAGGGGYGERLTPTVIHHRTTGGGYSAAAAGAGRNSVCVASEGGRDRVVGGDVTEGIAGDGADRAAVHCYAGNLIAGGGGHGERLTPTVIHHRTTGGGYSAATAVAGRNSICIGNGHRNIR